MNSLLGKAVSVDPFTGEPLYPTNFGLQPLSAIGTRRDVRIPKGFTGEGQVLPVEIRYIEPLDPLTVQILESIGPLNTQLIGYNASELGSGGDLLGQVAGFFTSGDPFSGLDLLVDPVSIQLAGGAKLDPFGIRQAAEPMSTSILGDFLGTVLGTVTTEIGGVLGEIRSAANTVLGEETVNKLVGNLVVQGIETLTGVSNAVPEVSMMPFDAQKALLRIGIGGDNPTEQAIAGNAVQQAGLLGPLLALAGPIKQAVVRYGPVVVMRVGEFIAKAGPRLGSFLAASAAGEELESVLERFGFLDGADGSGSDMNELEKLLAMNQLNIQGPSGVAMPMQLGTGGACAPKRPKTLLMKEQTCSGQMVERAYVDRGRPILFSGDMAAARRVDRVARRAARAVNKVTRRAGSGKR